MTQDYHIEITVSRINAVAFKLPEVMEETLRELAEIGQDAAEKTTLFQEHSPSGLKHNIKIKTAGQFIREVLADKEYAYWIEFGNNQRGQFIFPAFRKALKFKINGDIVFAKKVRTHGPLPFMKEASEVVRDKATEVTEKHLRRLIEKYNA